MIDLGQGFGSGMEIDAMMYTAYISIMWTNTTFPLCIRLSMLYKSSTMTDSRPVYIIHSRLWAFVAVEAPFDISVESFFLDSGLLSPFI